MLLAPHGEARAALAGRGGASSAGTAGAGSSIRSTDRAVLVPFLAGHADPWIREQAAPLLVAWHEQEALLGLTHALARLGARSENEALLPLVGEPPQITWAIHLALLGACERLGVHPGRCEALREADNIDVQVALASVRAASTSVD
ncbi:hypothetical protein [Sorangium sp. So ce1151]|uniref:hypothetical protein n=1 Tax=Sorangium sp. So ce1151 TaxID=3133332 RepID=UPI003F625C0A